MCESALWSASQAVTSCGRSRHRLFVTWATPSYDLIGSLPISQDMMHYFRLHEFLFLRVHTLERSHYATREQKCLSCLIHAIRHPRHIKNAGLVVLLSGLW